MTMKRLLAIEISLIALTAACTVFLYPHLPASMPVHWDIHLRPDIYMPKWYAFLLGPGVLAVISALTRIFVWASPQGYQVDAAQSSYRRIMLIVFCLCLVLYGATLWATLGSPVKAGIVIAGFYCAGLISVGNVLGKLERNFFIGVITPWTITSERVWFATHRLAAWLWVGCGFAALLLLLAGVPEGTVLLLVVGWYGPKLYSLLLYKQLEKRGAFSAALPGENEAE